jgi:hypothetical protein
MAKLVEGPFILYTSAPLLSSRTASSRTLIISTHGEQRGTTFPLPSWTHVLFCTPNNSLLQADLGDAIRGTVGSVGMPTGTRNCQEFSLTHFEGDPPEEQIRNTLRGHDDVDVLVLVPGSRVALSGLVTWLESKQLQYPRLQGLFCRVDASGQTPTYGFVGTTSATSQQAHDAKLKAQVLNNELMSKFKQ